jgi:hypothetical protein
VLWNTRYLDVAPSKLRASGYPVLDENVARLSPLGDPVMRRRSARAASWNVTKASVAGSAIGMVDGRHSSAQA